MIGNVGGGQDVGIGDQDAGDVDGDVAIADHNRPAGREVRRHLGEMRVGVVPADEVYGGDTGQVLTGDAHWAVRLGAHGVDNRVVALGELIGRHVFAHGDVAEESESLVCRRLLEGPTYRLDFGMVGEPLRNEPNPKGQHFDHVDMDVRAIVAGHRLVSEAQQ